MALNVATGARGPDAPTRRPPRNVPSCLRRSQAGSTCTSGSTGSCGRVGGTNERVAGGMIGELGKRLPRFHRLAPGKVGREELSGGKALGDFFRRKLAKSLTVSRDMDSVHRPAATRKSRAWINSAAPRLPRRILRAQHANMAIESLTSIPLRTPAKEFSLPNVVTGEVVSLSSCPRPRPLVVMFICRHCPYVVHVRDEILRIARHYQPKGVSFMAICSNDSTAYPDDSPERLREMAIEHDFPVSVSPR